MKSIIAKTLSALGIGSTLAVVAIRNGAVGTDVYGYRETKYDEYEVEVKHGLIIDTVEVKSRSRVYKVLGQAHQLHGGVFSSEWHHHPTQFSLIPAVAFVNKYERAEEFEKFLAEEVSPVFKETVLPMYRKIATF